MSTDQTAERKAKLEALLKSLVKTPDGFQMFREAADSIGISVYEQVSEEKFMQWYPIDEARLANARRAIILDAETTGVDTTADEVIELAMIGITYDDQGIISINGLFEGFNQPKKPISPEITRLTGITDEMVKGKKIEDKAISDFIAGADMIIAHNAGFDRKMVERSFPGAGFDKMPWHCSFAQVDWIGRGNNGRSLESLALGMGLVYGSHRANVDILATAFILNSKDETGKTAFSAMVEKGNIKALMLITDKSPFAAKDALKDRGYRWSADGQETSGYKAWYKIIEDDLDQIVTEATFLREVYAKDMYLPAYETDAVSRYSARPPGKKVRFGLEDMIALGKAQAEAAIETETDIDIEI